MSAPIYVTLAPHGFLAGVGIQDIKKEPEETIPKVSRKRRLEHLTWEQKLQHKKMKNRVAAQASRDRKKEKMDQMEDRIQELADEVAGLKALNERLLEDNGRLRDEVSEARVAAGLVARADLAGPAESLPRQQERSARAAAPAALCRLLMLCLLSQNSSSESTSTPSLSSFASFSEKSIQKLRQIQTDNRMDVVLKALQKKWWGPQQSNWNPVEIS